MGRCRRTLVRLARRFANRVGLDITSVSNSPRLVAGLRDLRRRGLQVSTVYDIGAFNGAWSVELARSLPRPCRFVLFEPNLVHRMSLAATGFQHIAVLLGDSERQVDFFSTGGSGDSIYKERTSHFDAATASALGMRRLDSVVEELGLPAPDMLKLDVQGAELDVLRGATRTLATVELIYLEVPILRYNRGAPSVDEYIQQLGEADFIPYSILELHRISNALVQADMLFLSARTFERLFGERSLAATRRLMSPEGI